MTMYGRNYCRGITFACHSPPVCLVENCTAVNTVVVISSSPSRRSMFTCWLCTGMPTSIFCKLNITLNIAIISDGLSTSWKLQFKLYMWRWYLARIPTTMCANVSTSRLSSVDGRTVPSPLSDSTGSGVSTGGQTALSSSSDSTCSAEPQSLPPEYTISVHPSQLWSSSESTSLESLEPSSCKAKLIHYTCTKKKNNIFGICLESHLLQIAHAGCCEECAYRRCRFLWRQSPRIRTLRSPRRTLVLSTRIAPTG